MSDNFLKFYGHPDHFYGKFFGSYWSCSNTEKINPSSFPFKGQFNHLESLKTSAQPRGQIFPNSCPISHQEVSNIILHVRGVWLETCGDPSAHRNAMHGWRSERSVNTELCTLNKQQPPSLHGSGGGCIRQRRHGCGGSVHHMPIHSHRHGTGRVSNSNSR